MAQYLIQSGTLTNIADAIREKAGVTAAMLPEAMPGYIRGIQVGSAEGITVPDYVAAEAERVAGEVLALQNSNTFTFLVTSDIHYSFDASVDTMDSFTDDLGNAVRLLRDRISPDFEADLGDKVFGATAYPDEDTVGEAMTVIAKLGHADIRMECLGNHDTHNSTVAQRAVFTAGRNRGAVYGDADNGYCYRDFGTTRVIVLNTSEIGDDAYSSSISMSTVQLKWLCTVLAEMTVKTGYHILILSHMPPDWGVTSAESELLKILKAYETGGSYTVDGTAYDFSAATRADIIGCAHGHLHNHKFRKIEGTNIWRFCVPGALKTRANEYSDTSTYPDGAFQELFGNETLTKGDYTIGTATSTAFSVVVVDPASKKISIINYGAGGAERNRIISYGSGVTYYAISNVLTNVANSNGATSVEAGASYTGTLTVTAGELSTVKITMGSVDITDTAYSNGNITIDSVTGNVVITAVAVVEDSDQGEFTNLVPTSVSPLGTGVYNGVGYKDGAYVTGINDGGDDSACVATGLILLEEGVESIYIKGAAWDTSNGHVRFYTVGSVGATTVSHAVKADGSGANQLTDFFEVTELGTNYYRWTLNGSGKSTLYGKYYCVSLVGTGADLIITHDEPIT